MRGLQLQCRIALLFAQSKCHKTVILLPYNRSYNIRTGTLTAVVKIPDIYQVVIKDVDQVRMGKRAPLLLCSLLVVKT